MGRVYEGIDKQTDSRVAVKVLHEDVAQDDVSLERFKREYEISALLAARAHRQGRSTSSATWSRRRGCSSWSSSTARSSATCSSARRCCRPSAWCACSRRWPSASTSAHARNFIHRDLKPDNVFLCGTREGDIVKLLDFGSVKDQSGNRKKLTVLGTTIGSPYYMSPEQAQGLETIDARADVFALAALIYECVTGEVPFAGNNGPSILLAILTKDPVAADA